MKGWSYPSQRADLHYFDDDATSLCGSWWIINPDPTRFHADPVGRRCKQCERKMKARAENERD